MKKFLFHLMPLVERDHDVDEDDDSYESNPDEQINEAIESDEGEDLQEGNFIVDITFLHAICLYSLQHQNANDQ